MSNPNITHVFSTWMDSSEAASTKRKKPSSTAGDDSTPKEEGTSHKRTNPAYGTGDSANSKNDKGKGRGGRERNPGRTGKGRGKGSSGSKGPESNGAPWNQGNRTPDNRNGDRPGTLEGQVELHRKMLVRLAAAKREDDKYKQFIVEVPDSHSWPELRNILARAPTFWREQKPLTGAHPCGAMHEFLFRQFTNWIIKDITANAETATAEQRDELKDAIYPWTFFDRKRPANGTGATTIVTKFVPLGRRDQVPETGVWRWILALDLQTTHGRDLHEQLKEDPLSYNGLYIRPDRAPIDGLEKALQERLRI